MNRIKARFWFSVTQPSVPSARRQTPSEISWSRSRWPVSDPTMFRSSCSLWSPASLKQHQQTRYTRVIIWEPFLFEDVCRWDEKKVRHQTLFEVCYLCESDGWNKEIQPGFDFHHWSLFGFFIVVEVISHINKNKQTCKTAGNGISTCRAAAHWSQGWRFNLQGTLKRSVPAREEITLHTTGWQQLCICHLKGKREDREDWIFKRCYE